VPSTGIKSLKDAGFKVTDVPGLDTTDFIINSAAGKLKNRELLNLKLREAFDHSIDRAHIARVVFLGTAKPSGSILPVANGSWHNPAVTPASFDLGTANRILDGLGYKKGSDGLRVANGHKMSYEVITPTDVSSVGRTFQILQADFRKIGVQLSQRALDSTTATDAILAPNNKYLNFDLALWDWTSLLDPDFMLSVVTCGQLGGWSDSGYCDKTYDSMYSQQQLTPDQDKRRAIVWRMEEYLAKKRPYLWLVTLDHVSAVSPAWKGLVESPQGPFSPLSKLSLSSVHQSG
jgi:peptide/nickel transport system substrate-binding protein